ncbi:arylamine N-acetyltransferase [Agromyces sp. Marseille-P2726]|uniref:arylamine N-acetyltransferase family protein n=1 Tax=Agromyces sp. Marseille-P2726 TaxID=2709132 RepID=UPI001570C234|nr:arylamine N-acetyltransferase [Agromyces sp. Marseille-P2726]
MVDIVASDEFVPRYLARIGWDAPCPTVLDRETIAALAEAHVARVPFENLRLHPTGAILLDEAVIIRRILDDGEGGLCYELNTSFGRLLEHLGARVELVGATVDIPRDDSSRRGIPLSHLALRVTTSADRLHVDVGFGGPHIVRAEAEHGERVTSGDGRTYVVDATARPLVDFTGAAQWHSSSPDSRFQRSIVCSVVRGGTAVTLFGTPGERPGAPAVWGFSEGGVRREVSADEARALLQSRFGMTRPLPTAVRAASAAA